MKVEAPSSPERRVTLPIGLVAGFCAAAILGMLYGLTGLAGLLGAVSVLIVDLPTAGAIFLAAGGFGWLAIRRMVPRDTPGGLRAVTSVAAGLWLLATAMLVAGSAGLLTPILWWPVVAVGAAVALWRVGRHASGLDLSGRVGLGAALLAGALAAAAGWWLAGATMPPGLIGRATGDAYDVTSYHLQVPREFLDAGRIRFLPHNTYGNYPLGGEMLFLLGMVLRGGARAGMYAAKLTHGLWGVLAVAALATGLPGAGPTRRRAAAMLAATAPAAAYLSWMAFVELSELAMLAVGVCWLVRWLDRPGRRSAAMIGLAGGVACSTKYLSVGLVAAPLLAAGALWAIAELLRAPRKRIAAGRFGQLALAGLVAAVLLAPWLVRNAANTGNPVFPLATGALGRGHWSPEQTARWDTGHAPPPLTDRPERLGAAVTDVQGLGIALVILAASAVVVNAVRRRRRDYRPLDWTCVAIFIVQLAVWAMATHMPPRFLAPALVPLAVLVGGAAGWVARRGRMAAGLAVAVLVAVVVWRCAVLGSAWRREGGAWNADADAPTGLNGTSADALGELGLVWNVTPQIGADARLLLVGEARAFYFPPATLYATAWEPGLLVRIARDTDDPREILRRLRARGVTHLLVNWLEIARLRGSYGWWDAVDGELIDSLRSAGAKRVGLDAPPVGAHRPYLELLELPSGPTASTHAGD